MHRACAQRKCRCDLVEEADPEQRGGLTTRPFVRYQLLRLGLGHDLTHVVRGGGKYLIAPPDEVLKLKPELQPAT